jgi:hypothetical protein
MANKTSKSFSDLIKIIKEFRVRPKDDKDVGFKELENPTIPKIFDDLTTDEKESLLIWLNRNNLPQA